MVDGGGVRWSLLISWRQHPSFIPVHFLAIESIFVQYLLVQEAFYTNVAGKEGPKIPRWYLCRGVFKACDADPRLVTFSVRSALRITTKLQLRNFDCVANHAFEEPISRRPTLLHISP
jgi:hypothetical protein